MVVTCMRVTGVSSFGGSKLLGSRRLSLRVEVFNFGFAEDAAMGSEVCGGNVQQIKTYIQVLLVGER
jgi:hypothetical protein